MKKILRLISILTLLGVFVILIINHYIEAASNGYIYRSLDEVPEKQVIIVLGAFVRRETLSPILQDRVEAGISLYEADKANKILLSGDHGTSDYDEVNAMRKYVLQSTTIQPQVIFLDHAGFDTYDSMYRAKEIFSVDSAIIVTQEFHIHRAVYLARALGIDAVGYAVDQSQYNQGLQARWSLREYLSRVKALLNVVLDDAPKISGEKIPITGDGRLSWD